MQCTQWESTTSTSMAVQKQMIRKSPNVPIFQNCKIWINRPNTPSHPQALKSDEKVIFCTPEKKQFEVINIQFIRKTTKCAKLKI